VAGPGCDRHRSLGPAAGGARRPGTGPGAGPRDPALAARHHGARPGVARVRAGHRRDNRGGASGEGIGGGDLEHTFGYHPLLCFLDATGEALAGLLRPGNAGSNTAADHITVLDQALHQISDAHRYGSPILIRSGSAGSSHEFLAHIRSLRERGLHTQFSVGVAITGPIRTAITVTADWTPAPDGDGSLRDGAQVVELTDHLDPGVLAAFPSGTRLICRRGRPLPARNCHST
jgi:hypothetical protein